jgi:hypothetical protein
VLVLPSLNSMTSNLSGPKLTDGKDESQLLQQACHMTSPCALLAYVESWGLTPEETTALAQVRAMHTHPDELLCTCRCLWGSVHDIQREVKELAVCRLQVGLCFLTRVAVMRP